MKDTFPWTFISWVSQYWLTSTYLGKLYNSPSYPPAILRLDSPSQLDQCCRFVGWQWVLSFFVNVLDLDMHLYQTWCNHSIWSQTGGSTTWEQVGLSRNYNYILYTYFGNKSYIIRRSFLPIRSTPTKSAGLSIAITKNPQVQISQHMSWNPGHKPYANVHQLATEYPLVDTGGTPGDTKLLDLNFQTCFQGKFRVPKMKAIHHFLSRLKINNNSPFAFSPTSWENRFS